MTVEILARGLFVSALDGFYSTWNRAKATFGVGTPTDGSHFDGSSSTLMKMKSAVESAVPDDRWQGTASQAYAAANKEHAGVYQKLADLDKKMAAEVTNAANIVTTGRTQLDTTKSWVDSMVSSLPTSLNAQAREKSLIPIANQGITQVSETVKNANGEMLQVGFRVTDIKNQYDELSTNQKRGSGSEKNDAEGLRDTDGDGKPDEDDVHKRAEQDVQDALSGDKEAAARVDDALSGITPGQKLSETQGAYLSQMQAQQHGMSVERLKEVRDQLGEHGDIIPNSWQLMSNKDVEFPTTKTDQDALDDPGNMTHGGSDKLPKSVTEALNSSGALYTDQTRDIANIVKSGDHSLQKGTELDRALIGKADKIMDVPIWEKDPASNGKDVGRDPYLDPAVSDVFSAVSADHEVIYDHLNSDKGQDFLHDVNQHAWGDKGESAGSLFEWTKDAPAGESEIAADTANIYADYLGKHGDGLLDLPGDKTIGKVNPELVQAYGAGLEPYQLQMVGEHYDSGHGFQPIDNLEGNMENTKRLFAVIDSDDVAAKAFNQAAFKHAMDLQDSFADLAKSNPDLVTTDKRLDDLQSSARLLGSINGGAHLESSAHIDNTRDAALKAAQESYDNRKLWLDTALGNVPQGGRITPIADALLGPTPTMDDIKIDPDTGKVNTGVSATDSQVQRMVANAQYEIATRMAPPFDPHFSTDFLNESGQLKSPVDIPADQRTLYNAQLLSYTSKFGSIDSFIGTFRDDLNRINGLPPKS
ncbi:EspA/EspE family type VII secretion system effector [Mycobacterium sp. NPDC050441]|uniref:TPR repeat region-containing protein n=1 Tax=Mycobacterium sp. NPDC050441 TaxID=3155403 RepID=UPI0033D43FEB